MIEKLLGLPPVASAHGHEIDFIIFLVHILMAVLFVGWGIFFILALTKFRKSRNPKADYTGVKNHLSNYIEIGVAVIEVILLVGFSIPFWANSVSAKPTDPDPLRVRVIAEQFAWNIHYTGADGVFGKTNIQYFDKQANPIGLDPTDPAGKDDIVTINQLRLPVNKQVSIELSTKDVIHSFGLPVMRVKQDAIPGMSIPVWFTPTKTGNFEIACAQLCGLGHYRMKGYLVISTPEEFNQWLSEQAAAAHEDTTGAGGDDFWN